MKVLKPKHYVYIYIVVVAYSKHFVYNKINQQEVNHAKTKKNFW